VLSPRMLWPAVAFSLGAVLTEFCGVLGPALGARRAYAGPMGKSDRALLVGVLGIATAFLPRLLEWWPALLGAAALLTVFTCLNRLRAVLAELRSAGRA